MEDGSGYLRDGHSGTPLARASDFNKITKEMTVQEIVSVLGPGSMNNRAGVAHLHWLCEDGRVLKIDHYSPDHPLQMFLGSSGLQSGRWHRQVSDDVRRLIASLKVEGQKAVVVLSEDSPEAKAGEPQIVEVGRTFRKVAPLPRMEFTITKIVEDKVHCQLSYEGAPQGIFQFIMSRKIILSPFPQ